MKKIYFLLAVVSLLQTARAQQVDFTTDQKRPSKATKSTLIQNNSAPARPQRCGHDYLMQKAKAKGYDQSRFESELARIIQAKQSRGEAFTGPVTIPVIFHSIYRNADALGNNSANLSAAKYQAQINQLNLDYANLSGSTYGVAADVSIRFCLAIVDTAGRPLAEPGIDRINGQARGWTNTNLITTIDGVVSVFDGTIKPATIWDPYTYLNVWTASMTNSGLLGYATFPGLSTLLGLDELETSNTAGLVIAWETVGSVANPGAGSPYDQGKTLTHELGHFLGLLHIWGDDTAPCTTDYCADTPPQDLPTSGCPAVGTLNNCIPSGPKMFQNYMDYSNDACMNTFTANQATRCQTVMDVSPRRLSLATSKACTARPANSIGFAISQGVNVSETGTVGACPNTKTYNVNLYISQQASANATVNLSVGGTAVLNRDYTITSTTANYIVNDNAVKTFTINIIDDQVIESSETIILSYTITGTGVIAGPDKQTFTINIIDDDYGTITVDNTNPVQTMLSQNFNASVNIPAGWSTEVYGDGVTTPNRWVVSANGGAGTSGNAAHITSDATTKPNTYNVSNISDAYLFSPLIDATGLKDLNLTFKWRCDGEAGYDWGFIGIIPEGEAVTAANVRFFNVAFYGQPTTITSSLNFGASLNNRKFYFVYNWENDDLDGTSPGFTLDDIVFTGKKMIIATTTDSDTAFAQYATQSVQYYSKAATTGENRIIASLNNLSDNVGCITAAVTAAGTALPSITTSAGSYLRSSKVITLTPASANTSASYQATFYFTTAELASWGTITGLKMMKVNNSVDLASTLTASNSQLVSVTVDDQRAVKGYAAFTGTFSGGFSQFILVSSNTALPVSLLSFDATAKSKSILLTWKTENEINNKGFMIQRSTNGTDFRDIKWVDGQINSNRITTYTYNDLDVETGITYYYRLAQTDLDNAKTLSDIRQAKLKGNGLQITIVPNPASDYLKLFTNGISSAPDIRMINTKGQLIKQWKGLNNSTYTRLDISGIAKGVYYIQIISAGDMKVEKLIIQ